MLRIDPFRQQGCGNARSFNNRFTSGLLGLIVGASLAGCASAALAADGPTLEERLRLVEGQLKTLSEENKSLRVQLGVDTNASPAFAKAGGKEKNIVLGGYFQSQFEAGDAPDNRFAGVNDRFLIRRARLNVSGKFAEQFDFKIEGDFGNNSVAGKPGYAAQLTDGFVNWNRYDFANVKFGQFKTPFGYEQLLSDTKMLTPERSLVNDRLTLNRQIGLGVAGDFLGKRLGYSIGMFNGNNINNGFNDDGNFEYVGRIAGVPLQTKWAGQDVKLSVGLNGYTTQDGSVAGISSADQRFDSTAATGVDNLFSGNRTGWGVDTQFKFGKFDLQAELLGAHFHPTNGNHTATALDDKFNALGWSVLAGYYVCPNLQPIVRYETLNMNQHLHDNSTDEWTFGLNYYIKGDDLKLQFAYLVGNPLGGEKDQGRFIGRMQIIF